MIIRFLFRNLFFTTACLAAVSARAQLLYVTNADGVSVTITGYTNSVPDALVIPTNINGLTVTAIGENAFALVYNLTSVAIPSTVTTIEEGAFNAAGLTDVAIPYGVTNIGEAAFADCESLTNVVIPESVTTVGQGAFDTSGLTSVTVPGSVTNFGEAAFAVGESLTNIIIEPGITSLGPNYLFTGNSIANVIIPASVTNLGELTFEGCTSLTNVFFLGNAPTVDNTVFQNDAQHGLGGDTNYYIAIAYYLPGTTGWAEFSSNTIITPSENPPITTNIFVPAVLWNPTIQATGTNFGVQSNQFGFDIIGTTNLPIAIEACDDLAQSNWVVLQRLTLTNGLFHFSERFQTNNPARFYRIGFP
jgi:hypothetical protein